MCGPGGLSGRWDLASDLVVLGKPIWETYLKGEEPDPKAALQKVADAVQAEIKRGK
jgi:predicted Rdx family selenoprotein